MRAEKIVGATLAVVVMAAPLPGLADSWKHGRGHGHHDDDGGNRECVYTRKQTPGMYKEEYKCRTRPQHWSGPPPWVAARAYPQPMPTPMPAIPYGFDTGNCNRETIASLIGGGTGALLGSRIGEGSGKTAAMVGGTILGFLVGGSVGRSMDRVDQTCMGQILEYAPNDRPIIWNNPATAVRYEVTPVQTYQDQRGRYCREYQTTAVIGGRPQQLYGTACRQPDGSWQQMD